MSDATATLTPAPPRTLGPRTAPEDALAAADVVERAEQVATTELGSGSSVVSIEPYAGGDAVLEVHAQDPNGDRVTLYVDGAFSIVGVETR